MFYISHKVIAILWFISLIVHAENFLYWFAGPAKIFCMEKGYMAYKIWKNKSTVKLVYTHENVIITVNWELHVKGSRIYNTVLLVTHIMCSYTGDSNRPIYCPLKYKKRQICILVYTYFRWTEFRE